MSTDKKKKVIGITGGTGCGKTVVMELLEKRFGAGLLIADKIGHELMAPGGKNYEDILAYFGKDILAKDGQIDRSVLSKIVFNDSAQMEKLNQITQPNIRTAILARLEEMQKDESISFIAFEAALIIEMGYKQYCDELWYVYADEDTRIRRLKEGRGYSEEKSRSVMKSQIKEEEYRKNCDRVIDNSGSVEETYEILRAVFEEMPMDEEGKNKEDMQKPSTEENAADDFLKDIDKIIEFRNNGGTVSKHMAMKVIDAGPGWAKGEMLCQAFHMNPIGSVHGGMLFILADFVAGAAALTRGKVVTTSNATVYFLNAAYMPKKIFAEAKEIKTGQCLSTYDVLVTDDKDKIISKMVIEFYNLRIDFNDYVNNMIQNQTDLYFDKNVFGEDKVEAKTFGLIDEEEVAKMKNSFTD